MKRSLFFVGLLTASAIALVAACSSSSDGVGSSSGAPGGDAATTTDGASVDKDGATTDALAAADSAGDANDASDAGDQDANVVPGTFELTSTAFAANASIPAIHTCSGTNVSPPLAWTNAPAGTQSYAVVMRDLSLVGVPNYHWVIYDIPAATTSLPQAVQSVASPAIPAGAKQTYWSFGADYSYRGPCPPSGTHDYQFTVYSFATATIPVGAQETDPAAADAVIQANKTGSAALTGKYMK